MPYDWKLSLGLRAYCSYKSDEAQFTAHTYPSFQVGNWFPDRNRSKQLGVSSSQANPQRCFELCCLIPGRCPKGIR